MANICHGDYKGLLLEILNSPSASECVSGGLFLFIVGEVEGKDCLNICDIT